MTSTRDVPPVDEVGTGRGRAAARPHLAAHHKRLERVTEALRYWERQDQVVQQSAPPQAVTLRPPLTRQTLQELRALLLEEIAHLEWKAQRGSLRSDGTNGTR
jgi:hypothetical protein